MLFALFFILGLVAAVGATLLYRFFTSKTIWEVFFPGRLPFWQTIFSILGMVLGLMIMALEVSATTPAERERRHWRSTWGWTIFVSAGAGFVGSWVGGLVTSYMLQYLTGWPVTKTPPAPPADVKP